MKVYISGAISGTTDYMERFKTAQDKLEALGYEVINPAAVNALLPRSTTYKQYMEMSFTMLDMADIIYMLDGWENSVGARMENRRALLSDIKIMTEDNYVKQLTREEVLYRSNEDWEMHEVNPKNKR